MQNKISQIIALSCIGGANVSTGRLVNEPDDLRLLSESTLCSHVFELQDVSSLQFGTLALADWWLKGHRHNNKNCVLVYGK